MKWVRVGRCLPVKFPDSATAPLGSRAPACHATSTTLHLLRALRPGPFMTPSRCSLQQVSSAYLPYYPIQLCILDTTVPVDLNHTPPLFYEQHTRAHRLPHLPRRFFHFTRRRSPGPWRTIERRTSRSRNAQAPDCPERQARRRNHAQRPSNLRRRIIQTLSHGGDHNNPDDNSELALQKRVEVQLSAYYQASRRRGAGHQTDEAAHHSAHEAHFLISCFKSSPVPDQVRVSGNHGPQATRTAYTHTNSEDGSELQLWTRSHKPTTPEYSATAFLLTSLTPGPTPSA